MMYYDKFVAAVMAADGKILREFGNEVIIPFGSDYSLLFKNLNTNKAVVKVSIDGQDVLNGHKLIVHPNDEFHLKGFIEDIVVNNSFRFIEKTEQISDFRGDRSDDGLIRIEFAFEKDREVLCSGWSPTYNIFGSAGAMSKGAERRISGASYTANASSLNCVQNASMTMDFCDSLPTCDDGITVKGEDVKQDFKIGSVGELDKPKVMVIKLKGTYENKPVSAPVTTVTKLICSTCGSKFKSSIKFCGNCGTRLV